YQLSSCSTMLFQPMPLVRRASPFTHADWLFEIKWDGFRALLHSDADGVRLISRNGNTFKSFPRLCEGLARDLKGRPCVLDGEIVCLDSQGKPQFRDLLFRRAEPFFYTFAFCGMSTCDRMMRKRCVGSETARTFATCR